MTGLQRDLNEYLHTYDRIHIGRLTRGHACPQISSTATANQTRQMNPTLSLHLGVSTR
jgi:hypothetical protein